MRRLIFGLLACLVAGSVAWAAPRQYESVAGDLTATRIYTLPNGLKVYLSVNKDKPRISALIAVRTGSRNDPAETTGLAHYLEHLMFKGTQKFGTSNYAAEVPLLNDIEARYEQYRKVTDPELRKKLYHEIDSVSQLAAQYNIPNEYDKLMASIGGEGTNAYTSNDVTCYTENIPANEVENWARIQSDRFQNMVIRGFHTELEAVYEEKNIGMAQDNRKLFEALFAKLFPSHPYGTQSTIGTQEHLKNPSINNIKKYFNRYYCPNNVAICLAGDLDFDATMDVIERYFGDWKANENLSRPEFAPMAPITAPIDTTVVGKESPYMALAWRMPAARSAESDTLQVVSMLLSNGNAGLIDLDLNQKMKVLDARASSELMTDYSMLFVYAMPKEGQTLTDARQLILEEMAKLGRGEFSDELLKSVINNVKRNYFKAIESNRNRTDMMVDAFINGIEWSKEVEQIKRIEGMTKAQIADFARRYLNEHNYVVCYKEQGEDLNQKKIEKPAITPIPTNRDKKSQFVEDIAKSEPAPIAPRFIDFKRDLTVSQTKSGLPLLYKKNTENGLFDLTFVWNFGMEADKRLSTLFAYMDYLGTNKMSNEDFKKQMFALACDYGFSSSSENVYLQISGLSENMGKAIALVEDLVKNAKPDQEAYNQYVDMVLKERADAKNVQSENFSALRNYAIFGEYNSTRNIMSESELRNTKPAELLAIMKDLRNMKHLVMYYGPESEKQVIATIDKGHKVAKKLKDVPVNKPYKRIAVTQNEVIIAPYEAKNIYMMQYTSEDHPCDYSRLPVISAFNEYFGGGMNSIVFQELREARGLAYSAFATYSFPSRKDDTESAYTYIATQNDKMTDCITEFNHLLDSIPQSEQAFDLAKKALRKQYATSRTTKTSVLWAYFNAQKKGIDFDPSQKVYEALPAIKLADVVNFEKANMAGKPYRYIILGDEKELDIKALEKIAPIRRVTTEEIFGY